jgi:hypothetical protein
MNRTLGEESSSARYKGAATGAKGHTGEAHRFERGGTTALEVLQWCARCGIVCSVEQALALLAPPTGDDEACGLRRRLRASGSAQDHQRHRQQETARHGHLQGHTASAARAAFLHGKLHDGSHGVYMVSKTRHKTRARKQEPEIHGMH